MSEKMSGLKDKKIWFDKNYTDTQNLIFQLKLIVCVFRLG